MLVLLFSVLPLPNKPGVPLYLVQLVTPATPLPCQGGSSAPCGCSPLQILVGSMLICEKSIWVCMDRNVLPGRKPNLEIFCSGRESSVMALCIPRRHAIVWRNLAFRSQTGAVGELLLPCFPKTGKFPNKMPSYIRLEICFCGVLQVTFSALDQRK